MYSTNLLVRCPANVLAPKEKERWSDEKCKELAGQIANLELSVQRAQESIDGARNRSNDPTLVDVVRKGNTALGLAGGVLGSYVKNEVGEIGGAWAGNSAAFVSLHDQFISATINFRDGNIKEGFWNVYEFGVTGTNTTLSNAKFGGKQLFKRAGTIVIVPTEIGAQGALFLQGRSIARQQLDWAREDIKFYGGLKEQHQGKVNQAQSDYDKHCK